MLYIYIYIYSIKRPLCTPSECVSLLVIHKFKLITISNWESLTLSLKIQLHCCCIINCHRPGDITTNSDSSLAAKTPICAPPTCSLVCGITQKAPDRTINIDVKFRNTIQPQQLHCHVQPQPHQHFHVFRFRVCTYICIYTKASANIKYKLQRIG